MTYFAGKTANSIWSQVVQALKQSEGASVQSSRSGPTTEILHAHFCLENSRQRWVSARTPAINPAFAIAEYYWILAGSNESAFINRWFPGLVDFQGQTSTYHGAYGYRIRNSFGFDQLERAYRVFQENPDSRQVVLQIWNPELDFPGQDGSPSSPDIPCNIASLLKVRNGRLEWLQIMRSNDVFHGMPYNIVQFTLMQETLAGWLGIEPGEYHQISDTLHYYEKDVPAFDVAKDTIDQPDQISIAISKADYDRTFNETYKVLSELASNTLSPSAMEQSIRELDVPTAYKSMTAIAAAEIARREGWLDIMEKVSEQCVDPALSKLWQSWVHRFSMKTLT